MLDASYVIVLYFFVFHHCCVGGQFLKPYDIPGQGTEGVVKEIICKINVTKGGRADTIKYVALGESEMRAWVVMGVDAQRSNLPHSTFSRGCPLALFKHEYLYSAADINRYLEIYQKSRQRQIFFVEKCMGCEESYTTRCDRDGRNTGTGNKSWLFPEYERRVEPLGGGIYCEYCFRQFQSNGRGVFVLSFL